MGPRAVTVNGSGWWPGTTRTTAGPRWRCGTGWRNSGPSWPGGWARTRRDRCSRRSRRSPRIPRWRGSGRRCWPAFPRKRPAQLRQAFPRRRANARMRNLYPHGVRTLADFDELDVIVAIQPHFQQVEPVTDVERRYNFEAVHVATLAADKDELTLSLVLGRRL